MSANNYTPISPFQSTPPARGATPALRPAPKPAAISIHAPREGGDGEVWGKYHPDANISIHAPREGGDSVGQLRLVRLKDFNPRPPRGGRRQRMAFNARHGDFNPRPPRGGRLWAVVAKRVDKDFNPRPPRGGRRPWTSCDPTSPIISIHAPREGGDTLSPSPSGSPPDFNPRPPRGGRRQALHPAGQQIPDFNPRPPRGGRRDILRLAAHGRFISIHAPREGGDVELTDVAPKEIISIHAPREGGDCTTSL